MTLNTDPTWWFVSERGNPDTKLPLYTSGNAVEVFVDGKDYMKKLYSLISTAGVNDYVFIAGWGLKHDLPLHNGATVFMVLQAAAKRGVAIRVLLSSHVTHANGETCAKLAELPTLVVILDSVWTDFGSAHQKLISICIGDVLHTFCGGIDLDYDRPDDQTHSMPPAQRKSIDYPGGWHDVQAYVRGPAGRDLDETFRERWRGLPPRPARVQYPSGIEVKKYPIDIFKAPPTVATGQHHVQVLRTYACNEPPFQYPFARSGEFSARAAFLKAISRASIYIYIEDQYFVSAEVADALLQALKANPQLRVIVVVPREPAADKHTPRANYYQARAIGRLTDGLKGTGASANVAFYELRNVGNGQHLGEQVYVHAKLMIVDDIWVEIGSMNCNIRSMTHDLEACVAVVDAATVSTKRGAVCKFARDLRRRLWGEHLALLETDASIQDPIEGYDVWKSRAEDRGLAMPAMKHVTPMNRSNNWGEWSWLEFIDPSGLCGRVPQIPAP